MAKVNAMEAFLDRWGIIKSWIAESIGMPDATFAYALERGFRPEEEEAITRLFHTRGRELIKFRFTDDHSKDVLELRRIYGIKKAWLAAQLRIVDSSFDSALIRKSGLTNEEVEILLDALKDLSQAYRGFSLPNSLRKAA